MSARKKIILLGSAVLVALCVRLLMLKYCYPSWGHGMTLEDEARNIFHGYGYTFDSVGPSGVVRKIPSVYDVPGYAYLLAFTWKVFQPYDLIYVQILQIILDSLCCLLVYRIALEFVSEAAAVLAGWLYAVYLPEVYLAVNVGRDFWGTLGILASFFFYLRYLKGKGHVWWILSAMTVGVAAYFRPILVFLPLAYCTAAIVRGMTPIKAFQLAIVMVFLAHAALFPWALRNHRIYGKYMFGRGIFYQSLWAGFGQFPNPFGAVYHEQSIVGEMRKRGFSGTNANSTYEFEQFIKPHTLKVLKEHPWWYLGTIVRRIPMAIVVNRTLWGVLQDYRYAYHLMYYQKNNEKNIWEYMKQIAVLNPGFLVTKFLDILVLGLAFAGAYILRNRWRSGMLLWAPLGYLILIHLPFAVEGRYIVPGHWVYLIFGSVSLSHLYDRLRLRHI